MHHRDNVANTTYKKLPSTLGQILLLQSRQDPKVETSFPVHPMCYLGTLSESAGVDDIEQVKDEIQATATSQIILLLDNLDAVHISETRTQVNL